MRSLKRRLMIPVFAIGLSSLTTSANAACSPGTPQLIIYHAGSLTAAFSAVENLFTQQTGVCVTEVAAVRRYDRRFPSLSRSERLSRRFDLPAGEPAVSGAQSL